MATFLVVLKSNSPLLLVKREEEFFRYYEIALDTSRHVPPAPGTAAIFVGGGVPKDFIQITATSVATRRGNEQTNPCGGSRPTTRPSAAWAVPASIPIASHGEGSRRGPTFVAATDEQEALLGNSVIE